MSSPPSPSGGRSKARLSSILVVAQIAKALLLLVCAGLFIRSFRLAESFNPGFNPHNVLLDWYDLGGIGYDQKSGTEFHREVFAKLQALLPLSAWSGDPIRLRRNSDRELTR
jgi:hypothetical protein